MKEIESYYKEKEKEIKKYIDTDKNYSFNFDRDNVLEILDGDNKPKLKVEYKLIGLYNLINSVWYWAWNVEFVNQALVIDKKKVKDFKNDLVKNYRKYPVNETDELYFISSNNNFFVSSEKVDLIAKLALYLNEGLWFLPICYGKNGKGCLNNKESDEDEEKLKRVEYILVTKILQINVP